MNDNKKLPENTGMDNEARKLGEAEMEQATGGAGDGYNTSCYFTPTGGKKVLRAAIGPTEEIWLECASNCFGFTPCSCHGKKNCKDKWHRIEDDGYLAPKNEENHKSKTPSNNYNT